MSLRDLANDVLSKFDPKNDDPNAGEMNLPDGEYDVTLANAEHKVFNSGWECLSFENEVTVGEMAGRKEFINMSFDQAKTPEFVLQKNIKLIAKLAAIVGIQLTDDDWEDETTMAAAFKDALGSQYILKVTSSPNKKDPSKPYRNFDFIEYDDPADNPNPEYDGTIDISDEDLPFQDVNSMYRMIGKDTGKVYFEEESKRTLLLKAKKQFPSYIHKGKLNRKTGQRKEIIRDPVYPEPMILMRVVK